MQKRERIIPSRLKGFAASLHFLLSQGLSKQMVVQSMIPVWRKRDVE